MTRYALLAVAVALPLLVAGGGAADPLVHEPARAVCYAYEPLGPASVLGRSPCGVQNGSFQACTSCGPNRGVPDYWVGYIRNGDMIAGTTGGPFSQLVVNKLAGRDTGIRSSVMPVVPGLEITASLTLSAPVAAQGQQFLALSLVYYDSPGAEIARDSMPVVNDGSGLQVPMLTMIVPPAAASVLVEVYVPRPVAGTFYLDDVVVSYTGVPPVTVG